MSILRIFSSSGPIRLVWNTEDTRSGLSNARAALLSAREAFETALAGGSTAFSIEPGRPAEVLCQFEPSARETVILPRMRGGAISSSVRRLMTQAGMTRLEEELERLRTVERADLAARLSDARESPGDQSDNLELLEAQHDYSLLEARIAELEYALAQASIVEARHDDQAGVGSVLVVRDEDGEEETYTLVGAAEADPRRGQISIASPVGGALLGARAGDETAVQTPAGARRLTVLKIE